MEIEINNRKEIIPDKEKLTVKELLELKNFSYKMLMVRINQTSIKTDQYQYATINHGDRVSVIHLMSGG